MSIVKKEIENEKSFKNIRTGSKNIKSDTNYEKSKENIE